MPNRSAPLPLPPLSLQEWARDTSNEDQITVDEFLQMMAKQLDSGLQPTEESLREAFRVFAGPEASFQMAAAELKAILMEYGEQMTEAEVDEVLREANIKPDGEVDFHAFVRTILKK